MHVNRSTETARFTDSYTWRLQNIISDTLQNIISDTLSEAKTSLKIYRYFMAFDSIDRTFLFGQLQCFCISTKFVKALLPLINENYVQIISGRNVDNILQTKGIPQGQCLSRHLYSIFTMNTPTAIEHETVDIRTQCIVYADDLAICCRSGSAASLQECLDNLLVYCTRNLLINLSEPFFDTNVGLRPNLARMCG